MLNEEFINDMFPEQASKDHSQQPLQEVSLNFTVSSRSSKHPRKQAPSPPTTDLCIFSIAEDQLTKFNQWLGDTESRFEGDLDHIGKLLAQFQKDDSEMVGEQDLAILKTQLFRKQSEKGNNSSCKECSEYQAKVTELETTISQNAQRLNQCQKDLEDLRVTKEVELVKEDLINSVEINLLKNEVDQLNSDIVILRNEKNSLEKTNFFNKTRNSDYQMLQKSKGLSAAKNSTNSSELMNRNETIVFIDPVESDVDEWIRFFESQKNRYMSLCKKQESDRMRSLGRSFTKEEKIQLHSEGRLFLIFSALNEIWKKLMTVRQNTNSFLNAESSKNFLKEKFITNDIQTGGLRQQNQKLNSRLNKLMRLNEHLLCQKENLEEINQGLKSQRIRQNTHKNKLEQEVKQMIAKTSVLMTRIKQYQNQRKLLLRNLEANQSEIQSRVDSKKYRKVAEGKPSGAKGQRLSSHKLELI